MSAARLSLLSNGTFVALLIALHVVKSDVDPSWHFISEYAIGKNGWIMQLAFLSLAVANVTTWFAIRGCLRTTSGKVATGLFLLGTLGLILAAMFVSDPINTPSTLQTTSGNIHNLGGALGLFGFLGTLIFSARLLKCAEWRSARKAVWIATTIVIVGFLISFVGITAIAARHQGVFGPDTPVGWPNRIGILGGCAWLAIIAWNSERLARRSVGTATDVTIISGRNGKSSAEENFNPKVVGQTPMIEPGLRSV